MQPVLEMTLRLGTFALFLLFWIGLEALWPRRKRLFTRAQRWPANFGLVFIGALAVATLGPLTAMGVALWAKSAGYGALNLVSWPPIVEALIALLVLDCAIYFQHWLTHKVPILWRLHRVHHSDRDIDASTALRFHPLEILFSMIYKMAIVMMLGPGVFIVIVFEILLNGMAMFNHANLRLPKNLDKALRHFIVTPDMHRVHHSIILKEQMHNFGFNLSLWDKLFGTYQSAPEKGQQAMEIGLEDQQTEKTVHFFWALAFPFR